MSYNFKTNRGVSYLKIPTWYKVYMGLIITGPPSQGFSYHFPYELSTSWALRAQIMFLSQGSYIYSNLKAGPWYQPRFSGIKHELYITIPQYHHGHFPGWWFQIFFYFHHYPWGNDPIWLAHIFKRVGSTTTRLSLFRQNIPQNHGMFVVLMRDELATVHSMMVKSSRRISLAVIF